MPDIQSAVGDPRDVRDVGEGDLFMVLNEEGRAALADEAWMEDQYNLGAFRPFRGEYVAVVEKKLLGHNKSLKKLREEVSKTTGYSIDRIVTIFIEDASRLP